MGYPWSDLANVITELEPGDKIVILRESDGANGSKIIEVEDFETSAAELVDKYIYTMAGYMAAPQVDANAVILVHVPTVDCVIPSSGNPSSGRALVAANAETVFSIQKNSVEVGTMTVGAGLDEPAFNFPSDVSLTGGPGGDVLTVIGPVTPDDDLALFGFTIFARR